MKKITPLKAIRAKCRDCSGDQPKEVRRCPVTDCPLFIYRFGRNHSRMRRTPTDGQILEKTRSETADSTNTEVLNELRAV